MPILCNRKTFNLGQMWFEQSFCRFNIHQLHIWFKYSSTVYLYGHVWFWRANNYLSSISQIVNFHGFDQQRERADTNQSSENYVTLFWTPLNIRSNTNTTIHHILHLHLHQLIYLDVFKTHFLYYRDYSIAKSKPKNFDNYFCCDKKNTHTHLFIITIFWT